MKKMLVLIAVAISSVAMSATKVELSYQIKLEDRDFAVNVKLADKLGKVSKSSFLLTSQGEVLEYDRSVKATTLTTTEASYNETTQELVLENGELAQTLYNLLMNNEKNARVTLTKKYKNGVELPFTQVTGEDFECVRTFSFEPLELSFSCLVNLK